MFSESPLLKRPRRPKAGLLVVLARLRTHSHKSHQIKTLWPKCEKKNPETLLRDAEFVYGHYPPTVNYHPGPQPYKIQRSTRAQFERFWSPKIATISLPATICDFDSWG